MTITLGFIGHIQISHIRYILVEHMIDFGISICCLILADFDKVPQSESGTGKKKLYLKYIYTYLILIPIQFQGAVQSMRWYTPIPSGLF